MSPSTISLSRYIYLTFIVRYSVSADGTDDAETEENLATAHQMTARFHALEAENKRLRQIAQQHSPTSIKRPYTVSERAAIFRDWSTVPSIGTLKPSTADSAASNRVSDATEGTQGSLETALSIKGGLPRKELSVQSWADFDEVVETPEAETAGFPALGELCALLDAFEANGLKHSESLESKADLFIELAEEVRSLTALECKLLEIRSPVYVFGDIHGNYADLRFYMTRFNPTGRLGWLPHKLLFLGDYVDRGDHSIEVVTRLFIDKICTRV